MCLCMHACRHAHAEADLSVLLSLSMSPLSSFLSLLNNRIKGLCTVPASSVWTSQHATYTCFLTCVSKDLHFIIFLFSEITLKSICRFPPLVWGFCSFVLFVLLAQGPPCVTQADRELVEILSGTWAVLPCATKKYFYFLLIYHLFIEMQLIFMLPLCPKIFS